MKIKNKVIWKGKRGECHGTYHNSANRINMTWGSWRLTSSPNVSLIPSTAFFVTVQVFFTFCFTLSLIATALTGILVLCPGEDFERSVLKLAYIDLFISCESTALNSYVYPLSPKSQTL